MKPGSIRVIPLGGLGEIGMNCMLIETESEMIAIDCGVMFSDLEHFGVEFVIPDFKAILDRKDKFKGFIMTHGHEDHVGAFPFAIASGLPPIAYASPFTSLLMKRRLGEHGLVERAEIHTFHPGETLQVGSFKIETTSVNHSIVDAVALLIHTPIGKIIHTGDFRIDPTPFYGDKIDMNWFAKAGDEGVLLLLSDSTNVEKCEHSLSEAMVYSSFEHLFSTAQGMIVLAMFASNVGRMGQIMQIAKKLGKKVALSGRSMEQNVKSALERGYLEDAGSVLISIDEVKRHKRNEVIVLSGGSQGESRSALNRIAWGEHRDVHLQKGDTVFMSSRFIPGNEKAVSRMINQLFKQGADVLYESIHQIHASGHATKPELKEMLEAVKPKFFIPVHGEYRHLVHHSRLAIETGMNADAVITAANCDVVEVTKDSIRVIDKLEDGKILMENRKGQDITKTLLKDRRMLGEMGVVFALFTRSEESGEVLGEPEVITRGLSNEKTEGFFVDEAKKIMKRVITEIQYENESGIYSKNLLEEIRVELRRFFFANIGKKPIVMVFPIDI